MGKLTLRNPAHVMPSVWTEDGEECVSDRVFNGWGPKIVRAVNSHADLLAACKLAAEAFVNHLDYDCDESSAEREAYRALQAAIAKAEAQQ